MVKPIEKVSPELRTCLDALVAGSKATEGTLAVLAERLLGNHPEVEQVRKPLKD